MSETTTNRPTTPDEANDDVFVEMCRMVDNLLSQSETSKYDANQGSIPITIEEESSDVESSDSWTYYDFTDGKDYYYDDNDSDIYELMAECNHGEWGN
ncbi:X protein [Eggplant mottled dwarf virus]|uniref:X protein n=1 Tax=Eggplant mottled dwarf virus TaxID=488317 RepID=X2FWJ8_9RHAB|nr:X protein [Eggplant mottled dwarf virus]AHN10095.1 X protein [Eggplant mottled dwarf virus]